MDDEREKSIQSWEKRMGSPVLPEPSEELSKTRFRLLVAGSLCWAIGIWDLKFGADSTILGLKVANLDDTVVRSGLVAILAYLFIHFVWGICDAGVEWRLRLTGYERAENLGEPAEAVDRESPRAPRQATLYSWWAFHAKKIGDLADAAKRAEADLAEIKKMAGSASSSEVVGRVGTLADSISRLADSVAYARLTLENARIPASLRRFDGWFKFFAISQNLRWFVFDLLFPLSIGIGGLFWISKTWWSSWIASILA